MRRLLATAVLIASSAWAHAQPAQPTAEQWRADLRHMAQALPARHRNLFHTMPRARFEAAVADLDRRIPQLARHEIIVEMARIVAMVGDGHTNIAPTRDPKIGFTAFPIAMYFFDDGLYVRAAGEPYKHLVGARVLKIGELDAQQAFAVVREVIGRDNDQGARYFAPHFLAMPEVLHALGMATGPRRARFTLEQDGRTFAVELDRTAAAPMMPPDTDETFMPRPGWADARAVTPLWLQDARSKFRLEYLKDDKLLYVQLNQVYDERDETLAQFAARISAFVAAHPVDKLALDLRLNRGGNGELLRPLVVALIKAVEVDRPGHLFVIAGRSTYSAAQFLVNDVERYTNAILVGEPTGGRPNSYGDSRKITLPNSGLTVRASTLWWQVDERDKRMATAPQLAADLTFADYRQGVDPALAVIRAYRPAPTLAERLLAAEAGGARRIYAAWRAVPLNRYVDAGTQFHRAGYALLKDKRAEAAVEVFGLWAELYPDDANAHDSLGEALLAAGRRDRARAAYERALALDPSSTSAPDALRKLGAR